MTTYFYEKGDYKVKGEKWDECPAFYGAGEWEEKLFMALFFGLVGGILFVVMVAAINFTVAYYAGIIIGIIICCCYIAFYWIRINSGKCGILIFLTDRNETLAGKTYHFTDNADLDAEYVAEIVKRFSNIADKKYLENEARRIANDLQYEERKKKSAVCCTRYKEVIDKITPEDK
jgi:hypothetical protein